LAVQVIFQSNKDPMKKLVIASNNPGKLREIERILLPLGLEILPQSAFNIPEVEEPYCTFIENCLTKARHASEHSGLPALADDSGICVDALNGAPGVYSARFAGEPKSDQRNNEKLIELLQHEPNRKAHYYCVMVLVRHPQVFSGAELWANRCRTGLGCQKRHQPSWSSAGRFSRQTQSGWERRLSSE